MADVQWSFTLKPSEGEYFKFNSNTGHAEPDTQSMQALSHFTYHQSKHGETTAGTYLLDPTTGVLAKCG